MKKVLRALFVIAMFALPYPAGILGHKIFPADDLFSGVMYVDGIIFLIILAALLFVAVIVLTHILIPIIYWIRYGTFDDVDEK